MESDTENIHTAVDDLLELLRQEGSTPISRAADELDRKEDLVEYWVRSLEGAGLVDRRYSLFRGTIVSLDDSPDHQPHNI